jgi:cysteinyl-tRNA synthetase
MGLRIYDTLSGRKQDFQPVQEGKVGMYFCGLTVQGEPHVGHIMSALVGDMMRRYLEHKGYEVSFIYNFTDVDDKIIVKAREEGTDCKTIAERNIDKYFEVAGKLRLKPATVYPKATEHIQDIIDFVKNLVDKGYAYEAGGDVYYDVGKFEEYGKLSKKKIDELQVGARIEPGEKKKNPMDFTLWKAQKEEDEPAWESPWGMGRPGWHIECSVMSSKYLGETFDIHGGGVDLVFPHHENEIAQSEAATGKPFVNFWVHNGHVQLTGEKMSKSTGHFFTAAEVLQEVKPEALRYYLLSNHYRSPIEFSRERVDEAARALERFENTFSNVEAELASGSAGSGGDLSKLQEAIQWTKNAFEEAMEDDFNSSKAIGVLHTLAGEVNKALDERPFSQRGTEVLRSAGETIRELGNVLGLFEHLGQEEIPAGILELAEKREQARQSKNWAEADRLRDKVLAEGYKIEDRPGGPVVRKVK